jgi:hypothetical protein
MGWRKLGLLLLGAVGCWAIGRRCGGRWSWSSAAKAKAAKSAKSAVDTDAADAKLVHGEADAKLVHGDADAKLVHGKADAAEKDLPVPVDVATQAISSVTAETAIEVGMTCSAWLGELFIHCSHSFTTAQG